MILSDNEKISISQIVKQDTVILRGVDSTVYSIVVDVGHGYIKFTGVSAFEGGYASIGKSQLVGVTDNMLVTAATGTYDLELDAGTMSGKKTVTVEKIKRQRLISVNISFRLMSRELLILKLLRQMLS